jgi:hypothetical protein
MKTMNIRSAFRCRFSDSLKSAGVFFGVMVLVTAVSAMGFLRASISFGGAGFSGTLAAYSISAAIALFVFGIVAVRADLRLCIQHGVGRRTAFLAELLSALPICFILALAGELLLAAVQAAMAGYERVHISNLYQGLYAGWQLRELSFRQHLESVFFTLSLILYTNMAGMFVSLVFFRLNKVWTVIVAVGASLFFPLGLPLLLNAVGPAAGFSRPMEALVAWILSGPWAWVLFFALLSAGTALLSWLLVRRAPINGIKG